jgi:hypothetical protein
MHPVGFGNLFIYLFMYLFIYLIHDIVYPYTTRGWKILDYSTCCWKYHSIYDLVVFPGNTSRIIENFQSSSCIIYDNIISDIVEPNIPDTIANIKQKSLNGRYFKELEQPEINIQASHAWLKKSNIHLETEGFIFAIQDRVINTRNYKKHICGLQSIIDKCRICGTEGETIEHIISSCTVLAQSAYKKRHDIFAKIIHMNLAVKFNLLKNTQPHYSYTPESCLENDNYKLYFDRTILTDIHIKHNRPDIIILNKQQKQAYLLDIAVPNSHNITQTYNTKINKYLELSVAMRNLWCLEKISILPLIISATGIVP